METDIVLSAYLLNQIENFLSLVPKVVLMLLKVWETQGVLNLPSITLRKHGKRSLFSVRLRWLPTVSSTFQDLDFDGSLKPLFIS